VALHEDVVLFETANLLQEVLIFLLNLKEHLHLEELHYFIGISQALLFLLRVRRFRTLGLLIESGVEAIADHDTLEMLHPAAVSVAYIILQDVNSHWPITLELEFLVPYHECLPTQCREFFTIMRALENVVKNKHVIKNAVR
jgi:hypothetical protein